MKAKIVIKNKRDVLKWIEISNVMARSMCDSNTALMQFNSITPSDRLNIKKRFSECDDIRRKKIPNTEREAWLIGIMVDAHILACEYNLDPLAVVMCVNPLCRSNERIFAK